MEPGFKALEATPPALGVVFTTTKGVPMFVRIVPTGVGYGRPDDQGKRPLVATEPLVEFWDLRYPHDPEFDAQFIARYYLSTLIEHGDGGLCLHGGIPIWDVDAVSMAVVTQMLRRYVFEYGAA